MALNDRDWLGSPTLIVYKALIETVAFVAGEAFFGEGFPAFGFVLVEFVGEFQEVCFPRAGRIHIDVLEPEVGAELLVFIITFNIQDNLLPCIETNVPNASRVVGSGM